MVPLLGKPLTARFISQNNLIEIWVHERQIYRNQKTGFSLHVIFATCLHIKPRSSKTPICARPRGSLAWLHVAKELKGIFLCTSLCTDEEVDALFLSALYECPSVSFSGLKWWKNGLQNRMKIKRLQYQWCDLPHPQGTKGYLLSCETPFSAPEAAAWGNDKPTLYLNCLGLLCHVGICLC